MTYDRAKALPIIRARLNNAAALYDAAQTTGIFLPAACALAEQETHGDNIFGHDVGGAMLGYGTVDQSSYRVMRWLSSRVLIAADGTKVTFNSQGVGPVQITSKGLLDDMEARGQRPWVPKDNFTAGFDILSGYHDRAVQAGDHHPWVTAGTAYNGSPTYGADLATKIGEWKTRLASAVTS